MSIFKYELSGFVKGTGKKVTSYVSAPLGISEADFEKRVASFMIAFEKVKATVSFDCT